MKKSIPAFLAIFSLSLVSAGPAEGFRQLLYGLGQAIMMIIQFISDMILNINSFDQLLFAKLIFFILIYLVIHVTISKNEFFGDNKTINKIITAAIAILAVRFIPNELVRVMFLQYGVLGAAIGMIIPFIIILFFLHQSEWGPLPRKISWAIYGASYISIFFYSQQDLTGVAGYVYWGGIIGILIALIFDKQIHAGFGSADIRNAHRDFEAGRLPRLREEQRRISAGLSSPGITLKERKILERREKFITKQISKILKTL